MVVEDFYGELLSKELLKKIMRTPPDQLAELAHHLRFYQKRTQEMLANRILRPEERQRIARAQGISSAYDLFSASNLIAQDSILMHGGVDRAITEMDELKYLMLYGDRAILPDHTLVWASGLVDDETVGRKPDEEMEARQLARCIRDLHPIADLIRVGDILLVPPPENLTFGNDYQDSVMIAADLQSSTVYTQDPYVAWLALQDLGMPDRDALRAYEADISAFGISGILGYLSLPGPG